MPNDVGCEELVASQAVQLEKGLRQACHGALLAVFGQDAFGDDECEGHSSFRKLMAWCGPSAHPDCRESQRLRKLLAGHSACAENAQPWTTSRWMTSPCLCKLPRHTRFQPWHASATWLQATSRAAWPASRRPAACVWPTAPSTARRSRKRAKCSWRTRGGFWANMPSCETDLVGVRCTLAAQCASVSASCSLNMS